MSASSIIWWHDGIQVTDHCSSADPRFTTTPIGNDCYLTVHSLGNYSIQGRYGCRDDSEQYAEAAVIVIGNLKLLGVYYNSKETYISGAFSKLMPLAVCHGTVTPITTVQG